MSHPQHDTNAMTMATNSNIPMWLQEVCARLRLQDDQLKNLNLNIRRLDPGMMRVLADAMRSNQVLVILNLTNSISRQPTEALQPLAELVLPHHASLTVLHLSYNKMQDMAALGRALASNEHLEEVYLDCNCINDQGAQCIAKGLSTNHALRVLRLSYNDIGNEGCFALASALEKNSCLLQLSLKRNNKIDQAGATSLKLALLQNCTLRELDLSMNDAVPAHCTNMIDFLCGKANVHREILMSGTSNPLWSIFLARLRMDPDLLYSFLRFKPDLFRYQYVTAAAAAAAADQMDCDE